MAFTPLIQEIHSRGHVTNNLGKPEWTNLSDYNARRRPTRITLNVSTCRYMAAEEFLGIPTLWDCHAMA